MNSILENKRKKAREQVKIEVYKFLRNLGDKIDAHYKETKNGEDVLKLEAICELVDIIDGKETK